MDSLRIYGQKVYLWPKPHIPKNIYIGKNHCEVQILRNCVHPELGLHIFKMAFKEPQKTLIGV